MPLLSITLHSKRGDLIMSQVSYRDTDAPNGKVGHCVHQADVRTACQITKDINLGRFYPMYIRPNLQISNLCYLQLYSKDLLGGSNKFPCAIYTFRT